MVDNSSCCLEDTYEQRPSQDSQEVLQPAYVLPEAPVRKELIEDVKQVIQEVKETNIFESQALLLSPLLRSSLIYWSSTLDEKQIPYKKL